MKYIALIAVIAIVSIQLFGVVPQSSVGGPMTLAFAFLVAALAVAIHDAWSIRRGVLGWFVCIVVSVVGAFLAAGVGGMIMDSILGQLNLGTSLAASRHPLLFISSAGMMLLTIFGSWSALWVVNRLR